MDEFKHSAFVALRRICQRVFIYYDQCKVPITFRILQTSF